MPLPLLAPSLKESYSMMVLALVCWCINCVKGGFKY